MTDKIKIVKFHKTIIDDFDSMIDIDDYKAFIDDKRVGFVRVVTLYTEDMEGRISVEEVEEEKQIDNEEVRRAIYQSIGW